MSAERISDEPLDDRPHNWTRAALEADGGNGRRRHGGRPHIWTRAALEAEKESGRREPDDERATAGLLMRACRISAGTIVTVLGLAMLVLPGPGFVIVAAGLSILAIDVPFARRLLQRVRRRLPQDADGGTPTWLLVVMGGGLAVGLGVSAAMLLT